MFILDRIAFCADTRSYPVECEQQGHRTRTSRSLTSCRSGWPRGFGELNLSLLSPPEYLLPSQWVPVHIPTYSLFGLTTCFTCLPYTTVWLVWHRTYPVICDSPCSRSARRSLLRYRNRAKTTVLMCEEKPYALLMYGFRAGARTIRYTVCGPWSGRLYFVI